MLKDHRTASTSVKHFIPEDHRFVSVSPFKGLQRLITSARTRICINGLLLSAGVCLKLPFPEARRARSEPYESVAQTKGSQPRRLLIYMLIPEVD